MKRDRVIYWATTAIVAGMMLFSAYSYLTAEEMKQGFRYMGFSDTFRIELAVAKALGSLALLIPFTPYWGKLFAYFGFTLTFISAAIVHIAGGDPAKNIAMPLVFLVLLGISYYQFQKLNGRMKIVRPETPAPQQAG